MRLYKRFLVQVHKLYELLPKRYFINVKKTSITLLSCGSSAIGGKNFVETFKRFKEWGCLVKINPNVIDSEYIVFYFRPDYKIKELTEELSCAKQKGSKVIAYVIEPITFNLYQDDYLKHKLLELTDAIVVNSVGYIKTDEWIYTKGFLNYLEKIVLIEEPLIESQMRDLSRKIHTKNEIVAVWHGHYRNMQRWIEGKIPEIIKDEKDILSDKGYYGNLKESIEIPIETICGYNLEGHCNRWHPGENNIARMLQKYDIGLAPFYTGTKRVDTKPFGLKIYSYIMAGLPVVASPIPDYLRWLKDGESCLFAESKEEWREACNRLKSPELRQKIADNARSIMLRNFSHDRILGKYELLFNSLRQNQQLPYLLKDSCNDSIR